MQTHAMAPLHLLCTSFMRSLATQNEQSKDFTVSNGINTPLYGVIPKTDDGDSDDEMKNEKHTKEDGKNDDLSNLVPDFEHLQIEKRLEKVKLKFLNEVDMDL